jgi:hypothetical protein
VGAGSGEPLLGLGVGAGKGDPLAIKGDGVGAGSGEPLGVLGEGVGAGRGEPLAISGEGVGAGSGEPLLGLGVGAGRGDPLSVVEMGETGCFPKNCLPHPLLGSTIETAKRRKAKRSEETLLMVEPSSANDEQKSNELCLALQNVPSTERGGNANDSSATAEPAGHPGFHGNDARGYPECV